MDASALAMPSGFRCPACGYDLSALASRRCPECGLDVINLNLVEHEARQALLARAGAFFTRQAAWWGGVLVVYSGAAGVFGRSIGVGAMALLTLGIAALGSIALGGVPSQAAPDWERQLVRMVWVRRVWLLHAPWLSIAFGACVALFAGVMESRSGGGGLGVLMVGVLGLPIWALGTLIAFGIWGYRWTQDLRDIGVRSRRVMWLGWAMASAVIVGAAGVGFVGGLLIAGGTVDLLGLDGGFSD